MRDYHLTSGILRKSGKYILNAKWLVPHAGHGMVAARGETAWKMYVQPAEVGRDCVIKVYSSAAETLRDKRVIFVHEPTSTYRRGAAQELGSSARESCRNLAPNDVRVCCWPLLAGHVAAGHQIAQKSQ